MRSALQHPAEVFAAVALTQNAITASVIEAHQVLGTEKDVFEPKASE